MICTSKFISISHTGEHNCESFFSAPLVRMVTVDVPFFQTVLSYGKSKVSGVWSALPMSESDEFRILRQFIMWVWNEEFLTDVGFTSYGQIVTSHEAIAPICGCFKVKNVHVFCIKLGFQPNMNCV